ncbi:MAG: hypothetical protein SF029_09720 [bacterium]|nr:hypothetical protein [bacterium]
MTRRLLALLCAAAALFLLADLAAAILFTQPLSVDAQPNNSRIIFTAAQDVVIGRCVDVRWDVTDASAVWINGQGRDLTGSESVCINEDFSRPQIYVMLPDNSGHLHELHVRSALYEPDTAVRYALEIGLIGVLSIAALYLLNGFKPVSRFFHAALSPLWLLARQIERIPTSVFYGTLIALFIVYIVVNADLASRIPAQAFMSEDYLNDQTIGEAWANAIRPLTLPLIYKLFNNDIDQIARVQWAIAVVGWGALAWALVAVLENRLAKLAGFAVVLLLSLTRDVAFWNSMLLSESLSNALFCLLLALSLIIGHRMRQPERFSLPAQLAAGFLLIVVAFFWSQTRDTNSYFLLGVAGLIVLGPIILFIQRSRIASPLFRLDWLGFALPALVIVGFVAIFLQQDGHANTGFRWQYSFVNVLAHRVLPFPDRAQFFFDRGMPNTPEVLAYAGQTNFAWTFDLSFPAFGEWIDTDAKSVYARYLLSRPVQSITEPLDWWNRLLLFEHNLLAAYMDTPYEAAWQKPITALVYTETWGLLLLSLVGFGAVAFSLLYFGLDWRLLLPLTLLLLVYPLAFLNWHGDSHAVERHALHVALQWRLALWLFILVAFDQMLSANRANPLD